MKHSILIVVTNRCNLNCIYCYETNKNHLNMSLEQAKSIVEREMSLHELYLIDVHGGEPLLNFPLIKELCEWFWATYPKSKTKFFITTNGTLFDGKKDWFKQHSKQIICALSLDGTPEMNQANRGCVIGEDTLALFHQLWPNQSVKMTISHATLPHLAEGVIFAHNHGFPVSANLAYGLDWRNDEVNNYQEQLSQLVDFYIQNPNLKPCTIFDEEKLIGILQPYSLKRHCQAGQTYHAYDIDGQCYPCHVFAGNTLESSRWEETASIDFKNDELFDDPECKDCPIHNICPTCYGMNFIERGSVYSRDKSMCDFIKAEKLATCKLHESNIMSKRLEDITEKEYLILSSINSIYKIYNENHWLF